MSVSPTLALVAGIVAPVVATLIPLGFLYLVKRLDFYQTGSLRFIAISMVWGVIAYLLAAQIRQAFQYQFLIGDDQWVRVAAPFSEEILKGLILLYLIRHADFKYFLDGAIYGFATGIGFAIIENFQYMAENPGNTLVVALVRVVSANLMHATGCALIGIALGLARFDPSRLRRSLYLAGALVVAIGLHAGFNNMVNSKVNDLLVLLFAIAIGVGGAGIIYALTLRALSDERAWVHQEIGLTQGVTRGEASVVRKLESIEELLAPLAVRFGPEKAQQIEKFLFMQAQLAIHRKTLEKLQDPKMKAAIEAQMQELNSKMNAARRSVGVYCMLYLRNIFPADDSPLWDSLQARISARQPVAGKSLWSNLSDRMKTPSPTEDEQPT